MSHESEQKPTELELVQLAGIVVHGSRWHRGREFL